MDDLIRRIEEHIKFASIVTLVAYTELTYSQVCTYKKKGKLAIAIINSFDDMEKLERFLSVKLPKKKRRLDVLL